MTKYTYQENATRKQVFDYNRANYGKSWTSSCTKKFGKSKVVRQAIIDSNKRIAYNTPVPIGKDAYKAILKDRIAGFAACLPASGYKMGERKYISCKHLGIVSVADSREWYARSSSYTPTHGCVEVELPIRLLAKGEVMDGMITMRGKQVQKRIWKAQWVVWDYKRNGRGIITTDEIGYHMESGYVVERHETRIKAGWYHSRSLADAREVLARYISNEKSFAKQQAREAAEKKAEEQAEKRRQREQEQAECRERKQVMAHRKNYTQRDVNRAAWMIFAKIATRQDSYLYRHVYSGYKLNIDKNDAFECDVNTAFEDICNKHDVVKELSKHNSRAKQAKWWSDRPVNILQNQFVKNIGKATYMNESRWSMSLPTGLIYAYSPRDRKIFTILLKMYRRKMAEKSEIVIKSAELTDSLQHMYVYRDSIAAGNCVPGTDGFIADHGLQKTDTRSGEFLLRISRGSWQHSNVIRVIEHYMSKAHADFYQQNYQVINRVLQTL